MHSLAWFLGTFPQIGEQYSANQENTKGKRETIIWSFDEINFTNQDIVIIGIHFTHVITLRNTMKISILR